ncbi:MAG: DUF362 domain-containing protein [Fuerstiella sp.]|nr:DUF362 domain-containing protein [Fuerstiella sp.]
MGAVYEEFKRELAIVKNKYAGDPRREMIQLFLMALEREELVSVGYRESLMEQRIRSMPLPDDIQRLIRHTLVWIWKDEEMHTIYIRGAILKLGGWRLRVQAFLSQAAGGVGGWAGSVMQHTRWMRAPVSRLAATIVTAVGCLLGKVPADVKQHLQFGPFRDFCQFNIDAEQTAAVCWYRIAELAESQPDLDRQLARDFKRVAEDEDRHCRIFEILANALGDDDNLVENETVESLVDSIREVGDEFLPRDQRRISDIENPIGSGQVVSVVGSGQREATRESFRQLLDECGLREALRRRAEFLEQPIDGMKIAIKPTFMLGYHRKDLSPLTDPELVDDLAAYLRKLGCSDIAVVEGRNIYDRFFRNRSVQSVAEHFGFRSENYRIVDTEQDQVQHQYSRGMAQYTIAKSWRDADFRISFPKLRSHPIEMALLCIGNIEWVGGRCDEYLFLERQADRATAVMMLLNDFPPHFGIVDAFENTPDGLVGVMGCQNPVHPLRFYAGCDALAVDTVALQHVGVLQFQESSLLRSTSQWFGGAANQVTVTGEDSPIRNWRGPYHNELRSLLSIMAYPMYVMGSGRGSLFVPKMDPRVFPLIDREKFLLRTTRQAVRWLLCLNVKVTGE